jgi:hypothetical protein
MNQTAANRLLVLGYGGIFRGNRNIFRWLLFGLSHGAAFLRKYGLIEPGRKCKGEKSKGYNTK